MKLVLAQPINRSKDINQNFEMILYSASQAEDTLEGTDILVLPELIGATSSMEKYENWVKTTAKTLKCTVVGGSHHEQREKGVFNCGVVASSEGKTVARYDKHRPYGSEFNSGIIGGTTWGQFSLNGRQFVILICSDLWYSSLFHHLEIPPDVVLTPTFSVTQKPRPTAGQNLWQFMAVSRAYEFSTYVGVSDWASFCEYDGLSISFHHRSAQY
ncbi:carbon-nitrogen hydrolase family protein [Thermodesulfobacteriota bacterium]